jgi:ABC-type dipeptide/oligopeptide/nickel transport system permease subunit
VEVVAATLGVAVGLLAGYHGGWRDSLLMRATDVVMAFPSLILAIGLIAVFERPGLDKVALVLVALGWTTIARVVRGEILSLKEREYVQAARALGVGHAAILVRHLLPNAVGPIIVAATIGVGSNMIAEAGLSFLGLGAQSPTISWGSMLAEGQTFLAAAPWVAFFPGAALLIAVLGINLLGDALRDLLDPRWRE